MLKKIISILVVSWIPCFAIAVPSADVIENKASLPILTPAFKNRETLKLQLNNGLQAYLISDPDVDKSSGALVVMTGSWEDPQKYPGIAHFLEHMLFMGTKKYPTESEYDRFISEHGGQSNAFTGNDFTGYVFTVDNKALPEALERFSSFFIEPLFNPSGVDRELHAIDQEYSKNIQNDDMREYYVHKELSNTSHPNHAFSMGNKDSLIKVSQETLKEWHKNHYSGNRMRLEVISNLPIDQIQTLIVNDFSSIPNTNLPPINIGEPLLSESVKGHFIYIEPIKNIRQLTIIWELPSKFADMLDTKPQDIISFVLGHEGKKSLLAELKREKLADGIQSGGEKIGGTNFEFFVQINLTDAGVKNVDTVILRCFEAITRLRSKKIPKYFFDEMHTMSVLNYQYQEREDAFSHILKEAMSLPREEISTYPEKTAITQQFDPKGVEEMLTYLTPENGVFDLIAPKSLTGISHESKEPWLGVTYTIKPVPEETMKAWKNAGQNPQIDLPEPNPYIPEAISVSDTKKTDTGKYFSIPHPELILNDDSGKIYFSKDSFYSVPTISWSFEIKTPAVDVRLPETIVLGDLFVKYATEALSDYTYPAAIAGLNFDLQRTDNGFSLSINGYSDKADELFLDLVKALKQLKPQTQKFKTHKDALLRQYLDTSVDMPLVQDFEILRSIIYKNYVTSKEKATAIRKTTYERLNAFVDGLFNNTYIEGLLYGNTTESQAKDLINQLLAELSSKPYSKEQQLKKEVILLPNNNGPFFVETKSKVQGNALILTIELGEFSFDMRASQQILMQAIKGPFFATLRTKQQTGYIVFTQSDDLEQHLFNTFAVQSNTHDGRDLLARFEEFLESFSQEIGKGELSEEHFNNIKAALLTSLKQPPQNTVDMSSLLYKLAFSYHGDFDRINQRIKAFEELSYEGCIKNIHLMLGKENKRRLAVILKGTIPDETTLQYTKILTPLKMRQLATYEPSFEDNVHE
ncbi:MAG: insulinase family protein [Parachlamydiaceae bacterium]